MKRICVIRHAKADRGDPSLRDIERPLTKRGKRDCKHMGRWIGAHVGRPALIVSSPAVRARSTASGVAAGCGYEAEVVQWDHLYPGDVQATVNAIRNLDESVNTVLIVGHNPVLEDLVSWLAASEALMLHMSTAAVAVLRLEDGPWRAVTGGRLTLEAFVSPKHLES
jgi:phosphohistidine phosphatase